jgi:hypothetical protein
MKFSIEAKVAAFVAVVFAALSMGAIAREHGERGNASTSGPGLSEVSSRGSDSYLFRSHGGSGDDEILGLY